MTRSNQDNANPGQGIGDGLRWGSFRHVDGAARTRTLESKRVEYGRLFFFYARRF